jgi:hypothetical protein
MQDESPVACVEKCVGANWSSLAAARLTTERELGEIAALLQGSQDQERVNPEDLSAVAFGSLARGEFTQGSDLDWALLVDGSASPDHFEQKKRIDGLLKKEGKKPPGREGAFSDLVFSHDLVHLIGGDADTNRNTTRRCLMLLESVPLDRPDAYENVIRAILKRYLIEDPSFAKKSGPARVPRFLLNDFARYWRTMAVDFAYKRRSRYGKGAALRNLKLRMSRKLLFASGLLTCFACEVGVARSIATTELPDECGEDPAECVDCLRSILQYTPLEIIALFLRHYCDGPQADPGSAVSGIAKKIFGPYDSFLGMLDDKATRDHLSGLEPDDTNGDKEFERGRELSHRFNAGILELFFDLDENLARLTRIYGVF